MKYKKIVITIIICIALLLFVILYVFNFRVIPVKSITSLETNNVDEESFSAMFTVRTAKEWIQDERIQEIYSHPEELYKKLEKMNDDQRVVISIGKRIKYFYYFAEGPSPDVHVVYYDEDIKNRAYFYIVNYKGSMIDYAHY